jgi:hypothetical protein
MKSCYLLFLALLLSVTAMAQTTLFDFEGAAPTFEDFNGSLSAIIDNPDVIEPNTSATVVENVLPIAQGFAGIKITQTIDLDAGKSFTMQVWSPIENAPVLLKFEGSTTSGDIERAATFTGAANSWQELTFDFLTEGDNVFEFVVVFMNFNVNTNTEPITFYWDNLVQIDVPAPEGDQMDLPVTFDDANINYGVVGFEGAEASIVSGPVDVANQVGQITKGPESGTSAGATVTSLPGGPAGFASPIPFTSTATTMSVRVWSPTANIPVRLKVENADNPGVSVETEAMVTVAAAWDTLVFDFSQQAMGTAALNLSSVYNKASLFFDFGSVPAATTNYFFDDMMFGGAGGGTGVLPVTLPVDFESTELTYDFGGFEGAESAIETNPDQTGENTSATVMRTTKTDGSQFFAGTFLSLSEPIDFSVNKGISIQSWSPKAGIPVRIRLEDAGNTAASIEIDVNTTTASAWETLEADFTFLINPNVDYVKVVVFFEFVVDLAGDGSTYYFDNIEVADASDGSTPIALPVGFEDTTNLNYDFGGFEGADSAIEMNPDQSGENTSGLVMRTTKTDGAQFFAGTFLNIDVPIDFSVNKGISIQSWSPKANIPVRIRLEDSGNTAGIEIDVNTTVADGWETLTADFSSLINPAVNYVRVVVFYEFVVDLPGDGATYYYDNIEVVEVDGGSGGTQMNLPVTFDDATVDYGLAGFGGSNGAIVADPTDATNMVGQVIKNAGAEVWAGVTMTSTEGGSDGFASAIPFAADATTITVRTWSPAAGTNILLKAEQTDDATVSVETSAMTTVAGGWETLTFDFSNEAAGTAALNLDAAYGKLSIFFDFGNQPAAEVTYYFDDVIFGGGGGGGDAAQMDLPVTFDEADVDYGLAGFGNSNGAIVADPTDATNMVGQVIKSAGAEVWAGVTMTSTEGGPDGFASAIPFAADATIITVRTWSPAAGTNILLKAEQTDDATVSVETSAMTTVAGGWETLTFDFSNEAAGTAALNLDAAYGKLSIFFDFGNQPAAEATYYFDDVIFGGGGGGGDATQMDLPVTFEDEGVDYGVADFGGNESMIVADPEDASNTVVQSIKMAGAETWGGTTLTSSAPGGLVGFASQIPFTATATKMVLRVWSPTAGTPVLLKVENKDDPTVSVETLTNTTVAGAWEELVFDFSMEAMGTAALNLGSVYDKASIFFDFGTSPTEATTYYWDDVYFGDVVGTNEPIIGLLEAFPNPVGNEFSIVAPERMESLILFSTSGRKMGEWQPMAERFTLEASHLAPGMYVALVRTERGLMTIKVMKK